MHKMLAIAACGLALAACSSSGEMLKTATPTVPLQFESEPAGAEVKTSGGQTCKTPCALAVPAADFMATFSLTGFEPQTVAVKMMPPDDPRGENEFGPSQPRFDPSPVYAELVKAPPPRRPAPKKQRATRPAAEAPAPTPAPAAAPAPVQPAAPAPSPWPPAAAPIR